MLREKPGGSVATKRKAVKKAKKTTTKKTTTKKKYGSDFHVTPSVTTQEALTGHLNEELREAWTEFRDFALSLGEQRFYAAHNSIMFAKSVCYSFVRPKKSYLEVIVFLKREMHEPGFKAKASSKTKWANTFKLVHRDQVEGALTDAVREAFESVE